MKVLNMMNENKIIKESDFYSKQFKFSYSSLNRLVYSPVLFYNEYVLGNKEIKSDIHLIEGKLIHYLMLDSTSFEDKYIIAPLSLPSDNIKMVADVVYELVKNDDSELQLSDYPDIILQTLKQINLYQKFVDDKKADKEGVKKTGDEKRLEKVLTPETIAYFNFLKIKKGRDIIDQQTLDKCTQVADSLKENKKIRDLLGLDLLNDGVVLGIYNEQEMDMELKEYPFGLKGIIDNMVVDTRSKTVVINDLKTSSKSLSDFPESVSYWNYSMQAAVYMKLVNEFLKDVLDDTWSITFNFIVIDKYGQVYPFKVSDESMSKWLDNLETTLTHAKYHYEHRDYSLPYQFITENVVL